MNRPPPSRRETLASLSVLAILAAVGVGIWHVQKTPSPAVAVYKSAAAAPEAPAASPGDRIPVPAGFSAMTPAEVFGPKRLSDKIDGKAEFYLAAGFRRLTARRIAAGDSWVEVFAYAMEDARSAFAVYSAQKRAGAVPENRFRFGYRTANALFFVHGPFYVEIVSSAASESQERLLRLAEAFAGAHPVAEAALDERTLFPEKGLVPDSIVFKRRDVFGFDRLNDVFTARYRIEGAELTAFLSRRGAAQEAGELARAYGEFLVRFGGKATPVDLPAENAQLIEIFGSWDLVFSSGEVFAGVHEAEGPGPATLLAKRLLARLSGGRP